MAKKHRIGAVIVGIFSTIVLIFTLGVPWYFFNETWTLGNYSCELQYLMSWNTIYCKEKGDCSNTTFSIINFCGKNQYNWRTDNEPGPFHSSSKSQQEWVFNVAVGLIVIAAAASLLLTIFMLLLCICDAGGNKTTRAINSMIGLIGLVAIIIAVVYFAVKLPGAFQSDNAQICNSPNQQACTTFWSKQSSSVLFGISYDSSWGGIGWVIAMFGFVCLAALTFYSGGISS